MDDLREKLTLLAAGVKKASRTLAKADTGMKDKALVSIAGEINENRELVMAENNRDLEAGKLKGLSAAFIDRLTLNNKRIDGLIQVLNDVINLKDPVGEIFNMNALPNGLKVGQMRVPIGVLAIIFESRPNVCIEVAALTIKSGNGVILRGGSDALHSNLVLTKLIKNGLIKAGLPGDAVGIVDNTNRESVLELVKLKDFIDV
ncbi:MAG TPA: hypothetical protein VHI78_04730, partial [Bacteroidales bacterium]|nr:hypothetical protein [Bacteroidales bacterium]